MQVMLGLTFRQVNAVFSPKVDKKMTTDSDQSGLMESADTVASPMYCTHLYVQLQHTKPILLLWGKKKKSNCTVLEPAHHGRQEWWFPHRAELEYPSHQSFIPDFWMGEVVFWTMG